MKKIFIINSVMAGLLMSLTTMGQYVIKGRVLSASERTPLAGATIMLKEGQKGTMTDLNGEFSLRVLSDDRAVLITTSVGFKPAETEISKARSESGIEIILTEESTRLEAVQVSTGYQRIPKERETGSFFLVDNKLLNRRTGMNILERIEDLVPGLSFIRGGVGQTDQTVNIRGQSTIFANAQPLIVIDNFPYEGDLRSVNPNDVESITVLKDAAATSIWGARAGNGVIVITTKSGRFNQAMRVSLTANTAFSGKPDLYYYPEMTSKDYISVERQLFATGYFASSETSASKVSLSPVTELLISLRDGKVAEEDVQRQLAAFENQDVRSDLDRYFYRKGVLSQLSLSLNGGSEKHRYVISFGHDKDVGSAVGNTLGRTSLTTSNTFKIGRLEAFNAVYLTARNNALNAVGVSAAYPYQKLVSDEGRALAVTRDLRDSFKERALQSGLLDWQYRPMEELGLGDHRIKTYEYRINSSLGYSVFPFLKLEARFQHNKILTEDRDNQSLESYEVRNLINRYSYFSADNVLIRPIPAGGILDVAASSVTSNNGRFQANLDKDWGGRHGLSAIAGGEIMDVVYKGNTSRYYGYSPDQATIQFVDYFTRFPFFNNNTLSGVIPNRDELTDKTDRYVSGFVNAAYTYAGKYVLSVSGRYDTSNLFGVNTNQKGTPLYSAGGTWHIDKEAFFDKNILNYLRFKLTYGVSGNIDKSLSAYTTAVHAGQYSVTGLPYAVIVNPPNPDLRWERVKMINTGIELQSRNRRFTAHLEYFMKRGADLIGSSPLPAYSGVTTFRGNTANTAGSGVELTLQTRQMDGPFKWYSDWQFSRITDKVTRFHTSFTSLNSYLRFSAGVPTEGKPLYALYSFQWAGLDPQTGDPRGYLNGEPSHDYTAIINSTSPGSLVYNGPARPTVFGSFRNTFMWKDFSLSANISYRLGYFFRMPSVQYGNNQGLTARHGDFAKRWQAPGDENHTYVPSVPSVANSNRDFFYAYSEVLVEKGDHIRLQDVRLSYSPSAGKSKVFQDYSIFLYASHLGILWKATSSDWDPDYVTSFSNMARLTPPSRSISIGFNINLK